MRDSFRPLLALRHSTTRSGPWTHTMAHRVPSKSLRRTIPPAEAPLDPTVVEISTRGHSVRSDRKVSSYSGRSRRRGGDAVSEDDQWGHPSLPDSGFCVSLHLGSEPVTGGRLRGFKGRRDGVGVGVGVGSTSRRETPVLSRRFRWFTSVSGTSYPDE